jgi:hypothetical protein
MTPRHSAQDIPSMLATLASYEGCFGPYHFQTLAMTAIVAEALCASGHRAAGRRLLERAVEGLTKYHGRFHPARLRALQAWSALLCQDEDWKAALPVQRELLECRRHVLGPDHLEALLAEDHLATTLSALLNDPLPMRQNQPALLSNPYPKT